VYVGRHRALVCTHFWPDAFFWRLSHRPPLLLQQFFGLRWSRPRKAVGRGPSLPLFPDFGHSLFIGNDPRNDGRLHVPQYFPLPVPPPFFFFLLSVPVSVSLSAIKQSGVNLAPYVSDLASLCPLIFPPSFPVFKKKKPPPCDVEVARSIVCRRLSDGLW